MRNMILFATKRGCEGYILTSIVVESYPPGIIAMEDPAKLPRGFSTAMVDDRIAIGKSPEVAGGKSSGKSSAQSPKARTFRS